MLFVDRQVQSLQQNIMKRQIIVIGAGITGVSCAEYLRRSRQNVLLVDAHRPGDPRAASFGNAGLLARAAITPVADPDLYRELPKMLLGKNAPLSLRWSYLPKITQWIARFMKHGLPGEYRKIVARIDQIAHDTVEQHLALAEGTKAAGFIRSGELTYLYPRKQDYRSSSLANRLKAEMGCTYDARDLNALQEIDPHLGSSYKFGTAYKHNGWIDDPATYVKALFDHYEERGGAFEKVHVEALMPNGIRSSDGRVIEAEQIVLAAGAWSKPLAKTLGEAIPLEGERGYHVTFHTPSFTPPAPYIVTDIRCGVTPYSTSIRCAGTTEFAPLDSKQTKGRTDLLRRAIKRVYPDLEWERETEWMGNRPSTPDSLPLLGRSKTHPSLIYATGGQHLGLTIGPKLGRLVRDIALDMSPNEDISPYSPDRFG